MSEPKALPDSLVHGSCEPGFEGVRLEFEQNFSERREIGASVCVVHQGRTVVDLWAGVANADSGQPWLEDTMVVVHSSTKGALALCAHILAYRGELDFDKPVSHYWPGFERNGKDKITVRMLLNHQAGLPGEAEPVKPGEIYDFDSRAQSMARQRPVWEPGTRHGYHAMTIGWLVGEVIRRVTGMSVGSFFRQTVAEPLGIDFWIGLPEAEESRVAKSIHAVGARDFFCLDDQFRQALEQGSPVQLALVNSFGGFVDVGGCDAPGAHAAEIPAANGITNARGLAGMYTPLSLGGELGSVALVDADQIAVMGAVESSAAVDACLFGSSRFTAGFEKASYGRDAEIVLSEEAFGHTGMGGCIGFVDPKAEFAFGYVMNRHADPGELMNSRYQPLVHATYRSLGYASRSSGRWR